MFRRKDENASDTPAESAQGSMPIGNPSTPHSSTGSSSSSSQETAPASVTSAPSSATPITMPSHTSPYAPSAAATQSQPAARPAAAAANTGGYRPAPLADFARGAARPADTQRAATAAASAPIANSGSASSFSAMSDKNSQKTNRRVLTVGNDILLKGEIATCDRLVIEGRVEAKLSEVHTVEIAECGSFKGTAEVEDAEISGVFEGDLVVRNRLVIYASGEVRGNITYGEIEIERGGRLTGQIKTVAVGSASIQTSLKSGMSAQEVKARAASKETFAA